MQFPVRWRPWSPRLLFAAVTALLVVVGIIQFQWFSQSAAAEIDGSLRAQESLVRQTVTREFQRYAPVLAAATDLRTTPPVSSTRLGETASRLVATYGPGGPAAGLVRWAGYYVPGAREYRRWDEAAHPTNRPLSPEAWPVPPGDGAPVGALAADNVLVVATGGPGAPVFLVGVDVEGFFRGGVFAALADVFPGATFRWDERTLEPTPPGFDRRTYAFNPFTALSGGAASGRTIEVSVPRFLDLGPRRPVPREGGKDGPGPAARSFDAWTLAVDLPANGPAAGVEGRLAWNWFGSTLLLVVLDAAFGLVLGQASRLAAQRRREREFVASVTHELRTPLTVIRSAADNFTRGIVAPERQGQYGRLIMDQVLRLGRMIEEMLALAQTEAGTGAAVEAPVVLGPWLEGVRPALEALAAARGVTLEWDTAGVPAAGKTDPEVLRLVVENLVVNAINHAYPAGAPGPKPVRITLKYRLAGHLEVVVDDDGRGIAPREARRVFDAFYRDEVSRNTQERGSGLGLFLAQRQARRVGGNLTLESPWRRIDGVKRPGCRFVATLPLKSLEEEAHGG